MGIFSRKTDPVLPFIEVPRGPRGGVDGRYFVLRGSADAQRAWGKATKGLGLSLPEDTTSRIEVRVVLRDDGRQITVSLGGIGVGLVPSDEVARVRGVMSAAGASSCEAEALIYRGQSGGWNGRVIV